MVDARIAPINVGEIATQAAQTTDLSWLGLPQTACVLDFPDFFDETGHTTYSLTSLEFAWGSYVVGDKIW